MWCYGVAAQLRIASAASYILVETRLELLGENAVQCLLFNEVWGFLIVSSAFILTPVDICMFFCEVEYTLALILAICVCYDVFVDLTAAFLASDEPPVQELLLVALFAFFA